MTTYVWKILSMSNYASYQGQQNVVFEVSWACSAVEGSAAAEAEGTVSLTYTEGEPFTAYADLTQDQVWGWVNPTIDRVEIEADLQTAIDEQLTPSQETDPLPWTS